MPKSAILTTRVDDDLLADVDRLAGALERSRSWILATAVERFVATELAFLSFIAEGEEDLVSGRTLTQSEVEERFGLDWADRDAA